MHRDQFSNSSPISPVAQESSAAQATPSRSFRESLLAMLGLVFVIMLVGLDQTVVGTALPTIIAELKGFDLYAWVATSYLLTSVIAVPIFGRLGDYLGRKYFVLASIVVFTLASVLCGMANSMLFLVLARGLQGIGGGMLVGTAFASVPDLFPDPTRRLKWGVFISTAFGLAAAIGPSLGGFLTQYVGWRYVFFVNLPVGLLALYFVARHMPLIRHHGDHANMRLDWKGALLIAAALGSLQLFVELLPHEGFSAKMLLLAAVALCAFAALIRVEKRASHPIVPMEMLANRALASLFIIAIVVGFAMFALIFYMPLLLQGAFGMSPNTAGVVMTPLMACITVGSISNGRLLTRIPNPAYMFYAGLALLACSAFGITTLNEHTSHRLMAAYMAGSGLGLGFILPNLTIFSQELAGRTHLGIATATIQSMRMVGGMLGTAIVGTMVNHAYISRIKETLEHAHATNWLSRLANPEVLISKTAQHTIAADLAAAGQSAEVLLNLARQALASSIHLGQLCSIAAIIIALIQVRRLPLLTLRRTAPARELKPAHKS